MYVSEDEQIDEIKAKLILNLKEFRIKAENRIMSSGYTEFHEIKLKILMDKMLELQIDLNKL